MGKSNNDNPEFAEQKAENMRKIADYLMEEGYRPNLDDDGDLVVKVEGTKICICQNDSDFYNVFALFGNNFFGESLRQELEAHEKINSKIKAVKIYRVGEDALFVGVEGLYLEAEHLIGNLEKIFHIINGSVAEYIKEIKKFNDNDDNDDNDNNDDNDDNDDVKDDDDDQWWK